MAFPTAVNSQITDSVAPDPDIQDASTDEAPRSEDSNEAAEDNETGE